MSDIPTVVPQSPTRSPDAPQVPLVNQESGSAVAHSPDHIVIDIPESEVTHVSPVSNNTDNVTTEPVVDTDRGTQEHESFGLRRSERERRQPRKLTYDELGEPLILAISSFFSDLRNCIQPYYTLPHTCAFGVWYACRDACSLEREDVTQVIRPVAKFTCSP